MKIRTLILSSALAAAAVISCKQQEPQLQYYATDNPYDIVSVTPPPAGNEVRNVILMIGDGMGLEQTSCAWVVNKGKLNIDNFPAVGLSRTYCTDKLTAPTCIPSSSRHRNSARRPAW